MAKRPIGLGKSAKKKQKVEEQPSNELTVELPADIDPDDQIAQLKALYTTFTTSSRDNELVINGIIHECDRILRNKDENTDLPSIFHAIYALALNELAIFHLDTADMYLSCALERVDLGLEFLSSPPDLLFAKAKILINRFSLKYLSKIVELNEEKKKEDLSALFDDVITSYTSATSKAITSNQYSLFNRDNFEFLQSFDDILDLIDHFGENDENEGDEDEIENERIQLDKDHILYTLQQSTKYKLKLRDLMIDFLKYVDLELNNLKIDFKSEYEKNDEDVYELIPLRREICSRIGQFFLQESEISSSIFTTLSYDDEYEGVEELDGFTKEEAQKKSQELIMDGLKYLNWGKKFDDPESWVNEAEAMISLGNLYEIDSEEQEDWYKKAEDILNIANNVTNGKYDDILENLKGDKEE